MLLKNIPENIKIRTVIVFVIPMQITKAVRRPSFGSGSLASKCKKANITSIMRKGLIQR